MSIEERVEKREEATAGKVVSPPWLGVVVVLATIAVVLHILNGSEASRFVRVLAVTAAAGLAAFVTESLARLYVRRGKGGRG